MRMDLPIIGLGTWELRGKKCLEVVQTALDLGYRHIDTAFMYENHREIGLAIKNWRRNELFITSKFMGEQLDEENVSELCDRALEELETPYLDLFLLHYPDPSISMKELLYELMELKKREKIREFGVSNFTKVQLESVLQFGIPIAFNQVEFHPYLYKKELLHFCEKHSCTLISYRSLGKGLLVKDPIFKKIGKKHGKTAAQVSLRWCIEKGLAVIPKASTKERLKENLQIFDFKLDEQDLAILDHLPEQRFCNR